MSMSFCVLGSGSAGNCTLLVLPQDDGDRFVLLDGGLSPRRTVAALAPLGLRLDHLTDILLTHLDGDHFDTSWTPAIERHDLTVHVHRRHRAPARRAGLRAARMHLFDEPFDLIDHARVQSVLLAHDNLGSVGFVIEHRGARLGWATDLGRVPDALYDLFLDLDALAIESNYDRQLQLASLRPAFLKQRIMGGTGHLSNRQSLDAVLRIAAQSALSHVALLHLSRQCNDPLLVKRLYADDGAHLLDLLTVTSQDAPSPMLHVTPRSGPRPAPRRRGGEQLTMFDSSVP